MYDVFFKANGVDFDATTMTRYKVRLNRDYTVYVNDLYVGKCLSARPKMKDTNFQLCHNKAEDSYASIKLFGFQVFHNGTMIHNFIPVVKNGKGFLYDEVGKRFATKEGTGNITWG